MRTIYYQNNKERLLTKAHERYQSFSEEEKDKKRQYAHEQYRNLSEKEKEKKGSVNMVLKDITIF